MTKNTPMHHTMHVLDAPATEFRVKIHFMGLVGLRTDLLDIYLIMAWSWIAIF